MSRRRQIPHGRTIAMSLSALAAAAWLAPAAGAEPAAVQVRIVGAGETLFEGPVLTEGHDIEASSDTEERSCDGVDPASPEKNAVPGPTPTAAAVDAMSIIGESFDGVWYAGYEDYLITRWGPETSQSWGLFVNDTLLGVGGCQYELHEGAEVLWSPGSMSRPLLALRAPGWSAGPRPLTAQAELDVPFTVEVLSYSPAGGKPPQTPTLTGSSPREGATIAPVQTAADGFEKPFDESPEAVETDAEGKASLTFTASGWHRIMASEPGTVRSNRLDVCVPAPGAEGCGAPPAEDCLRAPASAEPGSGQGSSEASPEAPGCKAEQSPSGTKTQTTSGGAASAGGDGQGPSSGSPPRTVSPEVETTRQQVHIDGLTLTPLAAASPALHYRGRWRRRPERGALDGAITVGAAGSTVTVVLGPGRPAFILRDVQRGARVEVRAAGHHSTFALRGSVKAASRLLLSARRARAGAVTLRIITGTVGIDGVAVAS